MKTLYSLLLIGCLLIMALHLREYHVVNNPNGVGLVSVEIKQAMNRMGPLYEYRLWPNGTLEVNTGNGEWLRLRYKRR